MIKDITRSIYGIREPITLLEDTRMTNMMGPAGVGISASHSSEGQQKSKFSAVAKIIDMIFDNNLKVYEQNEDNHLTFIKFRYDGTNYTGQIMYNGDTLETFWENYNIPPFALTIAAFVQSARLSEEIRQALWRIKTLTEKKERDLAALEEQILLCCDAFYFGYIKTKLLSSQKVNESSLEDYIIDKTLESGLVEPAEYMPISFSKKKEKQKEKTTIDLSACTVPYQWDKDQENRIPHSGGYVMTPAAEKLIRKIAYRTNKIIKRMSEGKEGVEAIENDYMNIILVGRPGSGKTKMAYAIAEQLNMPIYTIPMSKNTEEDTVEGKNKVVDGKIDFVETDFLKAYQNGGIVILEEINLADPAVVMGSLGQAIEYPFIVMKDGYIPVRRHPMCVIIATMNTGTAGSKGLNEALSSRFKQTYILEDPSREIFLNILESKGFEKKHCRWVYSAYQRILNTLKTPGSGGDDCADTITLRSCIGALECIEEGCEPKDAIRDTMIGKIAEKDLELAKKIEEEVVDSLSERM